MRLGLLPLAFAAAAALTLGTITPAFASASDPSECDVTVQLQKRVTIASWSTHIDTEVVDPDLCLAYATWYLTDNDVSTGDSVLFTGRDWYGSLTLYTGPSGTHSGRYVANADHATTLDTYTDDDGVEQEVTVNQADSNVSLVRYGSHLTWRGAIRSGHTVTLSAAATRYSPFSGFGGFVKWSGARVQFQKRTAHGWKNVKTVRTGRDGVATARVKAGKTTWRAVTGDTSKIWGKTTTAHTG